MSEISSVNTSFYPELLEGFAPKSFLPVSAIDEQTQSRYLGNGAESNGSDVDLSHYYDEVRPEDILTKTGQNLVESAQVLDNTMVIALQNGYSVQDVCNIKLAEMAYKANAYMFKVAGELSTFELDV